MNLVSTSQKNMRSFETPILVDVEALLPKPLQTLFDPPQPTILEHSGYQSLKTQLTATRGKRF
jgi:hypothetical protein